MRSHIVNLLILLLLVNYGRASWIEDFLTSLEDIPEDGRLEFCALANKYGYNCIKYNVTTKDGYILGVYNIPGNVSNVVYLQHGFLDASDTFLARTNASMVAYLADKGYDVWLGNMRGNIHSRQHESLDPDGSEFWEFSFHQVATCDLTATIDFILEKTGQTQLQAIGHSEGTLIFYVLGSIMPEYNAKVKLLISLAPIGYLHNAESPLFPLLSLLGGTIPSGLVSLLGHGELLRNYSELATVIKLLCTQQLIGNEICVNGLIGPIAGYDNAQLEESFLKVAFGKFPAGTSLQNAVHLLQIILRKKISQYDYGSAGNLEKYNSTEPPDYDLSKYNMTTVFVVGLNDRLSDVTDVQILREQLPNIVDYHEIEYELWNHVDHIWGSYMPTYLFNYVLEKLQQYN